MARRLRKGGEVAGRPGTAAACLAPGWEQLPTASGKLAGSCRVE